MDKKEKNVTARDEHPCGDCWDHVAYDPEHRLVVSLMIGRRDAELTELLVADFHRRTAGRIMGLMTSDEYPCYAGAILSVYGVTVVPERTGRPGRPEQPYQEVPRELVYATVHKTREGNKVVGVEERLVFGGKKRLKEALRDSAVSERVTTVHIERFNGTDRHRNARKVRKTYRFSKEWEAHGAVSRFSVFSANFCQPVRTLRVRGADGRWQQRTPALAAGLADHVWSIKEWLTLPAAQRS